MSTTRYITGTSQGLLTILARAVDPDGNIISNDVTISVDPSPVETVTTATGTTVTTTNIVPQCYSAIMLVSRPQTTLEAACAQFGTQLQYYIGAPRNTIYSTKDCSVVAENGYYKLDDGTWILVSGGIIIQRGSCESIGRTQTETTRAVPQPVYQPFITPSAQPTMPTAFTPIQVFVPQVTFTPFATTITPPEPGSQPIVVTTTFDPQTPATFMPGAEPEVQQTYGCTDSTALNYNPSATVDDGSCQYPTYSGYTTNYDPYA